VRFEGRQLLGNVAPTASPTWGSPARSRTSSCSPQMTVLDNLMLGRHRHVDYGTLAALGPVGAGLAARRPATARWSKVWSSSSSLQAVRKSLRVDAPYGLQKRVEAGPGAMGHGPAA